MSWFKRPSGDLDAEPPEEAPGSVAATDDRPQIEPLTPAEVEWVRSTIAELGEQDVRPGDIDDLGRHYDELLSAWIRLREADRPDPGGVIDQIGLAFGQYVADQTGLDWAIATAPRGPQIALHRAEGDVLLYPTAIVAERWTAQETRTLPALARASVDAVRATA